MDSYQADLMFPPQSSSSERHEDLHIMEDMGSKSPRRKFSGMSLSENQEAQSSLYIDEISRKAQDMVKKINDNRASDQKMMDTFQEKIMDKVSEMCEQVKEQLYKVNEKNNDEMQLKLQELSQVLENCTKLTLELQEASQALKHLQEGLSINQAPAM